MSNYLNLSGRRPQTRKDMIEFLLKHPTHSERMFSEPHYSRTVKITHLPLTRKEENACFDELENPLIFSFVQDVLDDFEKKHPGGKIFFGGRTNGHLELHGAYEYEGTERDYIYWDFKDIRWLSNLVWDFDLTCEEAVATFVDFAVGGEVAGAK